MVTSVALGTTEIIVRLSARYHLFTKVPPSVGITLFLITIPFFFQGRDPRPLAPSVPIERGTNCDQAVVGVRLKAGVWPSPLLWWGWGWAAHSLCSVGHLVSGDASLCGPVIAKRTPVRVLRYNLHSFCSVWGSRPRQCHFRCLRRTTAGAIPFRLIVPF